MIILSNKDKNFDKLLESLLLQRKKKLGSKNISVSKIIHDVKKNGDKADHFIPTQVFMAI